MLHNLEINNSLKKFWEVETIPTKHSLSIQDRNIIDSTKDNLECDNINSTYEVKLPWKHDKSQLQDNYDYAYSRLKSVERKLMKNPELDTAYDSIVDSHESKGFISKDKSTSTTKVRLVFDASAKYDNYSLSDVIYRGPKLQNELFNVLLRSRMNAIAVLLFMLFLFVANNIGFIHQETSHSQWCHVPSKQNPTVYDIVDSSCTAYGAATYCTDRRTNRSELIVAPLKSHDIPWLELMDAVLGLKLSLVICSALNISIESCVFSLDSMNVLYWIQNQSRLINLFVTNDDVRHRWRLIQLLLSNFWKRWIREYLPTLGKREKWRRKSRDFKIGDVVLVLDSDIQKGHWRFGIVTHIYPGPDNRICVVDVKVGESTYRRPITRLSLIVENCDNS